MGDVKKTGRDKDSNVLDFIAYSIPNVSASKKEKMHFTKEEVRMIVCEREEKRHYSPEGFVTEEEHKNPNVTLTRVNHAEEFAAAGDEIESTFDELLKKDIDRMDENRRVASDKI